MEDNNSDKEPLFYIDYLNNILVRRAAKRPHTHGIVIYDVILFIKKFLKYVNLEQSA